MQTTRTETLPQTRSALRIDKWLWAARFFKTRALASKACDIGRILSGGVRAKPARDIHAGDLLQIENEGGLFQIEVLKSARCAAPLRLRKRSTAKPKPAAKRASNSPKSARPCSNSRRCRSADLPSATGGALFNSRGSRG